MGNFIPIACTRHQNDESEEILPQKDRCNPYASLSIACHMIADTYGLSKREEEVLGYFARGKSCSAVAEELHIGPATVKTHSSNIYQKLNIHSRDELITFVEGCLMQES